MCETGHPSNNQALLLLRSCGLLLSELLPAKRTEIAHTMWTKMKEHGIIYDVSHYNALLKVYLQNEHEFSPTEFLTKMEEANIQPNRVTYQRLIAAYCSKGDMVGASDILSFMKSKDLPVMESVFSALVTGHARAGDMENAENILSVMKDTGIEPGPDTYVALLNAYAEKGDITKIEETLGNIEKTDCYLMDRDLMDIIFTLTKAGYSQYVQNILKKMRYDRNYTPDAMNLCLRLITHGLEDTAFQVLKSFPSSPLDSQDGKNIEHGSFFLHHCLNMNMPVAKLKHFCDEMKETNLHSAPLVFVLRCALQSKKAAVAFDFMKMMKEKGIPVRPHYFWPLLAWHQKEKNLQGTVEVINAMHEMNVVPNVGTYKKHVLPQFDDTSSASHHLQEMGCRIEVKEFCLAQIIYEASEGSLYNVLALMSSRNMSSVDHMQIRMSLISGFRKFVNADLWSKITELLYKDGRYYQTPPGPSEAVGYFLFSLIDNMSDSEVQAKEEQLRQYFHQLNEMKIKIPPKSFRGIQQRLDSCHVPELIKAIMLLVRKEKNDMNERGENTVVSDMQELDRLKAENMPVGNVLTRVVRDLCLQENLQKALEVKAEYRLDLEVGNYASLIHLCCRQDNAEEAMNLKEELSQKYPSEVLSLQKYLALVEVLGKCGRLDDAINILKEMKEKDVHVEEKNETSLFHILNNIAQQGDVEAMNRLHETITSLGLAKITRKLCSPLITVHLSRNDIPAALEAVLDCCKKYDHIPRFHDVLCKLIENGHTELLQKAVDFVTQEKGELMMLYDLFFAFLSTGKYKEAKKIVETQGFRPRPSRFQWFALKCIANNEIHVLENLVELTENLFECDRDEMYYYLLRACKENNDWQKAEAAWVKMQEENIIPRERTLRLLANILKSNNQEVPFDISQIESDESIQMLPSTLTLNPDNLPEKISRLSNMDRVEEAFDVFLEAKKKNIEFEDSVYLILIEALLKKGCLEEAMKVKEIAETHIKGFVLNDAANSRLIIAQVRRDYLKDAMLTLKKMVESDMVPFTLAVVDVVNALGQKGDVEGIQTVKKLIEKLRVFPKRLSVAFINNIALAYINKNSIDEAIDYLEPILVGDEINPKIRSISFLIKSLIDNKSETALERVSAMAERLANQFGIYRPATNLFLQYIDGERVEDAKHLLERCSIIGEQKAILNHYFRWTAMKQGESYKIKTVLDLVSDLDKNIAYFYLLKSYVQCKDLTSAQNLFKKLIEEKMQPDEMFLKTYAVFLRKMGESVPFVEPSNKLTLKEPEYSSDDD